MSKVTKKKKIAPPMLLSHVMKQLVSGNLWTMILATLTIASAFALVILSHEQRKLFAEQEQLSIERNRLDTEERALIIEQRTLGEPSRLEQIATESLDMKITDRESERIVKQVSDGD